FSMRLMFNCGGMFYAFNRNTTNFCPRNAAQDFTLGGNFEVITFDSARFADDDGYVRGIIFQLKSEKYVAQFFADYLIPLATHYTPVPVTPIDANIYGGVIGGNAGGFNIRFDDRDAFSNVATGSVYRPTNCIYVNGTLVSNVTATVNADKTLHIAYGANEGDVLSIDGQIGMEYVGPISFQYKNGEWLTVLGGDASEPFIFETLLNNPSFTSGTTRWQIYGKPSSCTDTMQSTEDGYSGKGMLIMHKGSAVSYSVRTSSNITVVPGATYQIRAKVKVSGNVKLGCSLYSNTTAAVCDKVENTTIIKNGNTEFQQVNYRLTVPAGTTSVKLQLEQSFASSAADVVYDEVAMYRVFPGGDINGDECVDVRDLVHFKKYFADAENVALSSLNAADVNRNGIVNVIDTVALKQIILRREDPSGIDPKVIINAPSGIVYPYADICKDFITTPGAQVKYYYANIGEAAKPIMIEWETASESYTSFTVEYGTKPDYSDAVTVTTNEKSLGLYNLYKDTAYYVRVTAHGTNGNDFTDETTFRTTDQGPRVMKIDGIYNVRDLGGYTTPNGTTLQGKIFRGSEMNGSHNIALTPAGDDYMSNVLGIKTDLDLRNPADSGYTYVSPISSANLQYVSIAAYDSAFKQTDLYRQIFSMMSYESNYPFYVHCWGGADRTGTVCFLVNALLGVDEETLVKDYEFTSYAIFGMRDSTGTEYNFSGFLEELKSYPGATLAEKTENYMLSIGVTADEIYNIRAIMYGHPTRVSVNAPATFDGDNDDSYV
nr:tyrosine-protein phosphatase [Clostridia bacterium]